MSNKTISNYLQDITEAKRRIAEANFEIEIALGGIQRIINSPLPPPPPPPQAFLQLPEFFPPTTFTNLPILHTSSWALDFLEVNEFENNQQEWDREDYPLLSSITLKKDITKKSTKILPIHAAITTSTTPTSPITPTTPTTPTIPSKPVTPTTSQKLNEDLFLPKGLLETDTPRVTKKKGRKFYRLKI
jgi:hypothetical protein